MDLNFKSETWDGKIDIGCGFQEEYKGGKD